MANLTMISPTWDTSVKKFGSASLNGGRGSNAQTFASASNFKMNAWVWTTDETGIRVAISAGANMWIGVSTGGILAFGTPSTFYTVPTCWVADGNPHFIEYATDASNIYALMDGVLQRTINEAPSFGASAGVYVGSNYEGVTYQWTGRIDEASFWNDNTQTTVVPTSPYSGSETNLGALYHLDSDGTDSVGAGVPPVRASGLLMMGVG